MKIKAKVFAKVYYKVWLPTLDPSSVQAALDYITRIVRAKVLAWIEENKHNPQPTDPRNIIVAKEVRRW